MKYAVIIEKGPHSYGGYAPDLPGCAVVGESREEVIELIQVAIELHVQDLRQSGSQIPVASSSIEIVHIAA